MMTKVSAGTGGRRAISAIFLALVPALAISAAQTSKTPPPPPPTGPYRIAGKVVSTIGGSPLAHVRVQIMDARNHSSTRSVVTSEDGRFEFHVLAGKFGLQGAKRGYISSAYNQHEDYSTAIVTGAGFDTENLILRLPPVAVLTGKILDESGEPVRQASVQIYRQDRRFGISRILPVRDATTDDQGAYEVTPLDEGTYFVSARATPWYAVHPVTGREPQAVDRALDVAYPITYYGDTTLAEDAAPIPVRGGDRLEADIHLNPVPALHLIFHADSSNGTVASPMLEVPSFEGLEPVPTQSVQVSPGVYEVSGIAADKYLVRMPDSSGQFKEPTEMDLSNGQELDTSSARSVSKIKAAVQVRGAASLPDELEIVLRNQKGRLVAWGRVDTKGEVEFQDVPPGTYDVFAGSTNKSYSVVHIASEGGDNSGKSLSVPAGAALNLAVSLAGGEAAVEGFAKRAGKPAAGAMIVLVPQDPEANHDLFRRDQSDLDGSFTLRSVIAGTYTLIAIEDGWDLDWAKPAVLAAYLKHGQTIKVDDHTRGTVHIPGSVEVQKK